MPSEATVRAWALDDVVKGFSARYARARNIGLDCQADHMLAVAKDKNRDPRDRSVEIDALKWRLCKLAPKQYGDRSAVEVSGNLSIESQMAAQKAARERAKAVIRELDDDGGTSTA